MSNIAGYKIVSNIKKIVKRILPAALRKLIRKKLSAIKKTLILNNFFKQKTQILNLTKSNEELRNRYLEFRRLYHSVYPTRYIYTQYQLAELAVSNCSTLKADAYVCHLPRTIQAGISLHEIAGGKVFCDVVENWDIRKHTVAPNFTDSVFSISNAIAEKSMENCDGLLTIGNELAQTLSKFSKNIHIFENRANYEIVHPDIGYIEQLGINENDIIFFLCGSVIEGIFEALEAISNLPTNVHLLGFVRFPSEILEKEVREFIIKNDLENRVHFSDFIEHKKLMKIAAACDVGLITNQVSNPNASVGLPNRLFDYIAAGLPIVATPMPDVKRIIQTHDIGYCIDTDSDFGWHEALSITVSRLEQLKKNVKICSHKLSWENHEERLIEALGQPSSVTFFSVRDLRKYQRFRKMAKTLTRFGVKVKAVFYSKNKEAFDLIEGVEYYVIDDFSKNQNLFSLN